MPKAVTTHLQPRKTPQQVRSASTVDAILEAAIQVLLANGATLTTTRVAARAGVSVGTLYQYFPNKGSLLQTVLQQHLDGVANAVEAACLVSQGQSLRSMSDTLIAAFIHAKFEHVEASVALYRISDSVEGKAIALRMHTRVITAIANMLSTAADAQFANPRTVAETMLHTMAGLSRGVLESGRGMAAKVTMQTELTRLARAYLHTSASPNAASTSQERADTSQA